MLDDRLEVLALEEPLAGARLFERVEADRHARELAVLECKPERPHEHRQLAVTRRGADLARAPTRRHETIPCGPGDLGGAPRAEECSERAQALARLSGVTTAGGLV